MELSEVISDNTHRFVAANTFLLLNMDLEVLSDNKKLIETSLRIASGLSEVPSISKMSPEHYFENEMSGEPLHQAAVIYALDEYASICVRNALTKVLK